jgi:hypothetical protein
LAEGDKKMIGRLKAVFLSGSLALSFLITRPVMADDWNKRIDFQFSAAVEVPGKVLAPGSYVFELVNSDSDRSIVQIYSKDSNGQQSPVTMIQAIPAYIANIQDEPVIRFEERPAGSPEAIHSWFYPGEHTGWEFVYPNKAALESATATPAPDLVTVTATPAPAAAPAAVISTAAPSPTPTSQVQELAAAPQVSVVREDVLIARSDAPAQPPSADADTQNGIGQSLPETAGYSDLGLVTGLAMLSGGLAVVFASRRKSRA